MTKQNFIFSNQKKAKYNLVSLCFGIKNHGGKTKINACEPNIILFSLFSGHG